MADQPILSITDLRISLPASGERNFAVDGVTLSVKAGEILCVVGESGSGKSVTAFAAMGLLPRTLKVKSGQIRLQDIDLHTLTNQKLADIRGNQMSMVFQEPMTALNPSFTIGDQIGEIYARHRPEMSRIQIAEAVESALEMVKLPSPKSLVGAYPQQLSGGQRQRVMIAMAMALTPKLLIADEPTTALDVTTQAHILRLMREMRDTHNTAMMFITHDFGVVADIADHVAVMEKGRLVETGTADQVLNTPAHPYTKKLIAAIPRMRTTDNRVKVATDEHPILRVTNLQKQFRTKQGLFGPVRHVDAVRDVNFDIFKGQSVAIVGESGSGKSTLMNCLLHLTEASSGSMLLDGDDFFAASGQTLRDYRRKIQVVFQDPYSSLNPRKTIAQSLLQGVRIFGMSEQAAVERARYLMSLVQLEEQALHRLPNQFSGGQRQRICIARALMLTPKVLIADEAVSALDVSIQAEVLQLLSNIRQEMGLTLLFVTHDLRVASQVSEQVMVMHRGEIVERGSVVEVFNNPKHAYTKALLDALPGQRWRPKI